MNLINIQQYATYRAFNLWDEFTLPDTLDRDVLVNTILDVCGEYEPLYYDLPLFKAKINNFFTKWNYDFNAVVRALTTDYAPLENYNRTENTTNSGSNITDVSAFDSDNYQKDSKNTSDNTVTSTIRGNIGVTTSQQMLESEIKLRTTWNAYQIIANKFYDELMLKFL